MPRKPKKNESKQTYLKNCTADLVDNEGMKPDQAFARCNIEWQESKNADASELRHGFNLASRIDLARKSDADGGRVSGFMINAYTGKVVDMGWWGKFIFDVKGISANNNMPVLREHMRDRIVGASKKFYKKDFNVYIQGKFSEATTDGQEVRDLAEEGYPWQASVGIWPLEVKYLRDEKEKAKVNGIEIEGPIEIWTKSQIRETSFVSLGADDDTAGIGFHLSKSCPVPVQVQYSTQIEQEKEVKEMNTKEMLVALSEQGCTNDELAEHFPEFAEFLKSAAKEEMEEEFAGLQALGTEEERTRIVEILEADADPKVTLAAIKDGTPASDFYKLAYNHQRGIQDEKLQELETETTENVVTQTPVETEVPVGNVSQKVAHMANELAEKEDISVEEATNRVLNANPELKDKYLGSFN